MADKKSFPAGKAAAGNVKPVKKPFLKGSPVDERTVRSALGFFGILLMAAFMSFLVSSALGFGSVAVRVLMNVAVEAVLLMIFYNTAAGKGSDAVARGEILYQRQQKGISFSAGEQAVCFHPLKGFVTGLLGSLPLLVFAVVLAATAQRQATGNGGLPAWMSTYLRRTEIGDALTAYTVSAGMTITDVARLIVRIVTMPFVAMVGPENRDGMLLLERLSPLIVLLPGAAYGVGYLTGKEIRMKVHTEIAQNNRRRAQRERRARRARREAPRGPQQLN